MLISFLNDGYTTDFRIKNGKYFYLLFCVDTSKLCKSYIFEAYTYLTDLADLADLADLEYNAKLKIEGEMKDSYVRSNQRLLNLLPEIEELMENNEFTTLDKWFKHFVRWLRDELERRIRNRCQQPASR